MPDLLDVLTASVAHLPAEFATPNARLLAPEHLEKLARRLVECAENGPPSTRPAPYLAAEITMPMAEAFAPFQAVMRNWATAEASITAQGLAEAMQRAGIGKLLVLVGQRVTPASFVDSRGIPPLRADLVAAGMRPVNAHDALSVAARAWAKHAARSTDPYWGKVRGSPHERNEAALALVARILDNPTWWNVFGHFQHEVVFEARDPTGHGARWGHDGRDFIGFLDDFDVDQRWSETHPAEA